MKDGILLLGIASLGALGAVVRYAVSNWASATFGTSFPVGTLIVNIVGCFCIGVMMEWQSLSQNFPENLRLAITAGFLGALTTFSTFGIETLSHLQRGQLGIAAINVVTNVSLGICAVGVGEVLMRKLLAN